MNRIHRIDWRTKETRTFSANILAILLILLTNFDHGTIEINRQEAKVAKICIEGHQSNPR